MADTTKPIDPGSARVTIFDPDTMTEPMEAIVRIGSLSIPLRFDPDGAAKLAYARRGPTFIPSEPNPAMTVQALNTFTRSNGEPVGRPYPYDRMGLDPIVEWHGDSSESMAEMRASGRIALDPKAARELLEDYKAGPATGVLTVGPGDTDYDAIRQAIEHCMSGGAQRMVIGMSSPGGPAIDLFSACDRIRAIADHSSTGSIGVLISPSYRTPKIFYPISATRRMHPRSLSRVKRQRKEGRR